MPSATADRYAAFEGTLRTPPDATVILEKHLWKVDSALLAAKSTVWAEIIENKEWMTSDKTITLTNDDPYIFARVLQFIYNDTYSINSAANVKRIGITNPELGGASVHKLIAAGATVYAQAQSQDPPAQPITVYPGSDAPAIPVEMHLIAEKYGIAGLSEISVNTFANQKFNSCKDVVDAMNGNFSKATYALRFKLAHVVGELFPEVHACKDDSARTVFEWLRDSHFHMMVTKAMSNVNEVLKKEKDEVCVEVQPPAKKARR